jgi:hypothetical protein
LSFENVPKTGEALVTSGTELPPGSFRWQRQVASGP